MQMLRLFSSLFIGIILIFCAGFVISLAAPGNPILLPPMNSHNNPATTQVSIEYDELIDASTVTSRTFPIYAMQTGLISGTYSAEGGKISMAPDNPFHPGDLIQATATTATLSITAEQPLTPTVWQFRIEVEGGSGVYQNRDYFGA